MTHRQEVGKRIAQARRELGVRERRDVLRGELAEAVGVDPSTITAWERGLKAPREEALTKLAAFLGVTPAYLRYGVGPDIAPEPIPVVEPKREDVDAARERVAKRSGKKAAGDDQPPPGRRLRPR